MDMLFLRPLNPNLELTDSLTGRLPYSMFSEPKAHTNRRCSKPVGQHEAGLTVFAGSDGRHIRKRPLEAIMTRIVHATVKLAARTNTGPCGSVELQSMPRCMNLLLHPEAT
jgi:hypothetical protein